MTATIKKLHQGLDNVDFIGTENINGPDRQHPRFWNRIN
jgi:hypothetical protein